MPEGGGGETQWMVENCERILPDEILDKLEAMLLITDGEDSDDLVWRHSSNGKLSVSSAYANIHNFADIDEQYIWNKIWQLKLPNRIRAFLWVEKELVELQRMDCKQWLMKPWDITVTHIFREQNRVADVLAKRAHSYDRGLLIFHQPVPDVVLSLEEDELGFPQGRLVSNMR
nr:ribonuclease H [Ipomoea batatas]